MRFLSNLPRNHLGSSAGSVCDKFQIIVYNDGKPWSPEVHVLGAHFAGSTRKVSL